MVSKMFKLRKPRPGRAQRAFTLIELLVVLAIMATLLTLVVPRYFQKVDVARENVLRQNLYAVRDAIDKFRADTGRYPATMDELVSRRYLQSLPRDPITERTDSWLLSRPTEGQGVIDLHSGAEGKARDGTPYRSW